MQLFQLIDRTTRAGQPQDFQGKHFPFNLGKRISKWNYKKSQPLQKSYGGSVSKEFACNMGDPVSIPGSGRSLGEENGNPLQYSCLENPMYRGAWWAIVRGVAKSQTRLSDWTHTHGRDLKEKLRWRETVSDQERERETNIGIKRMASGMWRRDRENKI